MYKKNNWSCLEIDYLKSHKTNSISQLSGYMSKSHSSIKRKLAEIQGKIFSEKLNIGFGRSKIGKRSDCQGIFFRSGWEANIYRLLILDKTIKIIEYEPKTFSFTEFGILKGIVSYTPDFKITYKDNSYFWLEIKGYLKSSDKTKIRRFKKYFPEEFNKLLAVTPGFKSKTTKWFIEQNIKIKWFYPDLNKKYKNVIPNWE